MNKLIVLGAGLILNLSGINAQKKFEKVVYTDAATSSGDLSLKGQDAVSTPELLKFKLKIENNSNDLLLYKPEESKFKLNGKEIVPKEKMLVIRPAETDHRVVNVKGTDLRVNEFSYVVDGLYKVSTEKNAVPAEDFQLPASQNEFTAGNFSCRMLNISKETDETWVKFECRYTGDKIGVINTNRAAVRLPDGTEIANNKTKAEPEILQKGDSQKFTLVWRRMEGGRATDMQKIKLMIVWRGTFVEADPVKVSGGTLDFKIDEAKSK